MSQKPELPPESQPESPQQPQARETMYCPRCDAEARPLECGDCHAIICSECGAPLERMDELGIG